MALLYSLYYAFKRHDGLWYQGMTFVGLYMSVLVFQTYWGIFTMRDTRWGTRASTVEHRKVDQDLVVALRPAAALEAAVAGRVPGQRPPRFGGPEVYVHGPVRPAPRRPPPSRPSDESAGPLAPAAGGGATSRAPGAGAAAGCARC